MYRSIEYFERLSKTFGSMSDYADTPALTPPTKNFLQ